MFCYNIPDKIQSRKANVKKRLEPEHASGAFWPTLTAECDFWIISKTIENNNNNNYNNNYLFIRTYVPKQDILVRSDYARKARITPRYLHPQLLKYSYMT